MIDIPGTNLGYPVLLQMANEEQRILITNDKGFGDLVIMQKKLSAGAILFRIKGQGSQEKIKLMRKLLMGYRDKLLNHYVIISRSKIFINVPLGCRKKEVLRCLSNM